MSGVTVVVVENGDVERLYNLMRQHGIAHYEMKDYFQIEGFTTLEQVEMWVEDK